MASQCFFSPCPGRPHDIKKCGLAGIQTLINKSQEQGDGLHEKLQSIASGGDTAALMCHKSCYSSYTSVSRNIADIKRKSTQGPLSEEPPVRIRRSGVPEFISKRDCLLCGQVCKPKDPKHRNRWEPVRQCETERRPGYPTFKQTLLDISDKRQDVWSKAVQLRLNGIIKDLPAAGAQYHIKCYDSFRKIPNNLSSPSVDDALKSVINYMNANKTDTWTITQLHDIYMQYEGSLMQRQMFVHIVKYFGENCSRWG